MFWNIFSVLLDLFIGYDNNTLGRNSGGKATNYIKCCTPSYGLQDALHAVSRHFMRKSDALSTFPVQISMHLSLYTVEQCSIWKTDVLLDTFFVGILE